MPLLNGFTPPAPFPEQDYHLETPVGEYDLNFCLDVPDALSTPGGVLLVPPSLHAVPLHAQLSSNPALFRYLPVSQFTTLTSFLTFLEVFRLDPTRLLFAIYDQSLLLASEDDSPTSPHRLAGLIGVLKTDTHTRSTEIGPVIVLPDFQRSHVMTHAAALVLGWAFDDLKLRRVQWFANERNEATGWDVWREEGREKIAELVAREVKPRTLVRSAATASAE
ncbi:hypothetical protein RQP46_002907 [Phenoliferia psychrophenolica]